MSSATTSIADGYNGFLLPEIPTVRHSLVEEMDAFDQLPWPLRCTLDYLPIKLSAVPVLAVWIDPPPVIEDLDCVERMQALATYLKTSVEAAL